MHKHVIEDELGKARRRITDGVIYKHHMEKFCGWFRDLVMSMSDADRQKLSVTLSTIGACPYSRAKRMKHYVTNGLKFRTKDSEKNKKAQNSGDDDGDTYCENVPYNIIGDNATSDNIGLARPDVQGTTIDAMVIEENEKQDGDFIDDNDFIDDEVNDEEYSNDEYNDE
nr:hypothetical protein CFP56_05570 [Quercus suber]